MKVTVIGGGSTYTPELVLGFVELSTSLPIRELWLMDIDIERLSVVGEFAKRLATERGHPFDVILSTNQREAVLGANYVIVQLRVGFMQARREDEYLGKRHGLIGQETTGVGGMAKALRTIPVLLSIAKDMQELAHGGTLLNFTNPAGLVTEALQRYAPEVTSVGVCNVAITTKMKMIEDLEGESGEDIDPKQARLDTLGLNHLTWHRGFRVNGEDVWPQVFQAYLQELEADCEPAFDLDTIKTLGMIPNYYLEYFYYTGLKLAHQEVWPPSRAEQVMEIEKDLLRQYADPSRTEPPDDMMKRGGAYYSTLATQLVNSHYNNLGETHVVNVRNDGAVKDWPAGWVIELPCRVDASGIYPIPAPPLPDVCFGLVAQVKSYELLTVKAAVHGDRNAAYQALLTHPLGPPADKISTVLEDLIEINKQYLPQF